MQRLLKKEKKTGRARKDCVAFSLDGHTHTHTHPLTHTHKNGLRPFLWDTFLGALDSM